jgi:hypothetical protein
MLPVVRLARTHALIASLAIALLGLVAGSVRVLPWLLDPDVSFRVVAPFARGVAAIALEAALVVGWPVGWALAACRVMESGEGRVLQSLGESPAATVKRLVPHGAVLALAVSTVALVWGSDASAPGRVATELMVEARASCAAARTPVAYVVPFTEMAWLCAPDREPRLAGVIPAVRAAFLTARRARIAGDFRAIELDDARVVLPGKPPISVHVGMLSVHGMAPWAHASTLPPALRAVLLALSAWSAASAAAYGVLQRYARARVAAIALGAAGPLAALGLLRTLERADATPAAFILVPVAACGCAFALGGLFVLVRARGARGNWRRLLKIWPTFG